MKTNKHTLDFLIRLCLYTLPIWLLGLTALSIKFVDDSSVSTFNFFNFNLEFNNVIKDCLTIPYLSDFYSWFEINLLGGSVPLVLDNVFSLIFYWVYCEFLILIKNILVFIFFVANRLIERGIYIGKD